MATETLPKPAGTSSRRKTTPPQYARELGVDCAKVLTSIKSGEMPAIDASTHRGNKPRYVIDQADIAVFEAAVPCSRPPRGYGGEGQTPALRKSSSPIENPAGRHGASGVEEVYKCNVHRMHRSVKGAGMAGQSPTRRC